jgi:hypothetical protein
MTNPTTPFSWQMPTSTDLVTDLPADFETFGQAVATSMADLLGGTTGQVLSKASNTNMDFTWVTTDDANAIQNSIVDAKGDLIGATANDTPARLAVGANGTTLVSDSTAATGLAWAKSPNFVGCALWKSASQSVANVTLTAITMDSEFFDTDNFHSTSTNTSRITIPAGLAGKYQLNGALSFTVNSSGIRAISFYRNGNPYLYANMSSTNGSYDMNIAASTVIDLAVGDYVEMFGFQNSGASLNATGNLNSFNSQFSATFLGA